MGTVEERLEAVERENRDLRRALEGVASLAAGVLNVLPSPDRPVVDQPSTSR